MLKNNQQILDRLELKRRILKYTIVFMALSVLIPLIYLLKSPSGQSNKFHYGVLIDSYPNRGKYGPDYICRVKLPNKQIIFASCGHTYREMSNVTVMEVKNVFGNYNYFVVSDTNNELLDSKALE